MQPREEDARHSRIVRALERLDARMGDQWSLLRSLLPDFESRLLHGADGLVLGRSGLDDIMRMACRSMREVWHSRSGVTDQRTAGYMVAIDRIARSYHAEGI